MSASDQVEPAHATTVATAANVSQVNIGLLLRLLLVPCFVAVCYQFSWFHLRFLTSRIILHVSNFFGLDMQVIAGDTIGWPNQWFQFTVSCTLIDAWCGAIPLVWRRIDSIPRNLSFLLKFLCVLTVGNVLRLQMEFVLLARGFSSQFFHESMSGVVYWCMLMWIWRRRAWREDRSPQSGTG